MLEKFTLEEIEQIKKELKDYRPDTLKKQDVCKADIQRLKEAYDDEEHRSRAIWPSYDINTALFTICDHITSNYAVNARKSMNGKVIYKHRGYVRKETKEIYRQAFMRMTDIIIELKQENYFPTMPDVNDD